MKNLHFRDHFKNFLYDLQDFITIYGNNLHVFNYSKLNKLSNTEIILTINNRKVFIEGNDLKIKKMSKEELCEESLKWAKNYSESLTKIMRTKVAEKPITFMVNISNDLYTLEGYVGKPTFSKPNRTYQTLVIN